ncbi:hypothetical protein FRC17_002689, partial [Serendipita sp. 399]
TVVFGGGTFHREASQILPNLYLSDAISARWGDTLERLGVTHIVCALEEPVTYPRTKHDIKILYIPVSDEVTTDLFSYFESATEFITDAIGKTEIGFVNLEDMQALRDVANVLESDRAPMSAGGSEDPQRAFPTPDTEESKEMVPKKKSVVLVHCLAGMSRSATIVCAYLLATTSMNTEETIAFVRSKRPIIQPNHGFQRQLKRWEAKHFVATRKRRVSGKQIALDIQNRIKRYEATRSPTGGNRSDDDLDLASPR